MIEPAGDRLFGRQLRAEVKTAAPRGPLHEQDTLAEELPANSGRFIGGIVIDDHDINSLPDEFGQNTMDVPRFIANGQEGGAAY
jgi:hypothetical protein